MPVFKVEGMSCQHCVKAITKAVQALDANATVDVDLANKQVIVESGVKPDQIAQAISDEGYQVLGVV